MVDLLAALSVWLLCITSIDAALLQGESHEKPIFTIAKSISHAIEPSAALNDEISWKPSSMVDATRTTANGKISSKSRSGAEEGLDRDFDSVMLQSQSPGLSVKQKRAASSNASDYVFDPESKQNLAVYFGSTNETSSTNLTALCNNGAIDIVILTFVQDLIGSGGYPDVDFSNMNCTDQTSEMVASNATGLVWCPDLADEIDYCQGIGKKIFVSIGGADGNITFSSDEVANSSAQMLWDTFGAGTGTNISYRPFGDRVIDGFDIDNESEDDSYWSIFATHLRDLFASDNQKTFYLSAAPGCYFPSPSAPLDMLTQLDFVWPQFYDSQTCGVGQSGFNASIQAWSKRLNTGNKPRMMIGALSFDDNGPGGYASPDAFSATVMDVEHMKLSNFGGVTLWDGAYGLVNVDEAGQDYVNVTKEALKK